MLHITVMLKVSSSRKCKYNKDLKTRTVRFYRTEKNYVPASAAHPLHRQVSVTSGMRALSPDRTNQLNVDCVGFIHYI